MPAERGLWHGSGVHARSHTGTAGVLCGVAVERRQIPWHGKAAVWHGVHAPVQHCCSALASRPAPGCAMAWGDPTYPLKLTTLNKTGMKFAKSGTSTALFVKTRPGPSILRWHPVT